MVSDRAGRRGPNALAVGRDGVWVAEELGGRVDRIDPDTRRVDERIAVATGHAGGLAA